MIDEQYDGAELLDCAVEQVFSRLHQMNCRAAVQKYAHGSRAQRRQQLRLFLRHGLLVDPVQVGVVVGGGGVGREAGGFELGERIAKVLLEAGSLLSGFSEFALQVADTGADRFIHTSAQQRIALGLWWFEKA